MAQKQMENGASHSICRLLQRERTIPVTLGKPDGSWYSNQYLWMYIPDEGITELPSAADAVKVIAGGTGAAYNDFNIVSSKAV